MNAGEGDSREKEERLGELFSAWLEGLEQGKVPDRTEWLARYPDLASDLEELLTEEERLHALAAPLREAARVAREGSPVLPETFTNGSLSNQDRALPGPFGDCELLEEIGRGGMGVVYRARQKKLGRLVALKLFRADPHTAAGDLQRFRHEAEVVAQLDHPSVVPVYEVGEHHGQVYFTMKLIEGGSLDTHLPRFRDNHCAAVGLLAAVARAVHHAHQRGILHRDLKPSNILLAGGPEAAVGQTVPHVSDFGLAKRVGTDQGFTHTGAVLGTPAYMAPEQATGRQGAITTASDVYGLGAILYALFTGRPPFQGSSVLETLEQVKDKAPEPPRRGNPKVPRDLETICLKCLQKDPQRRYESAAALADDLERFLRGEPIQARRISRVEHLWLWCRRQPVQAALTAALLVAVVTGVSLVFWQWRRAEENYQTAEVRRREAYDSKTEADESLRMAHAVVQDFTTRVVVNGQLEEHGLEPLRLELLRKAQGYFRKFQERPGLPPSVRLELAEISAGLAEAVRQTGPLDESLSAYQHALELYEALLRETPQSTPLRLEQAKLYNHLGAVQGTLGQGDEALGSMRQAKNLLEEALRSQPEDPGFRHELGCTIHNLAMLLASANQVNEALDSFAQARAIQEQLLREQPENPEFLAKLANTLNNAGVQLVRQGRLKDALPPLRKSATLREQLTARFPNNLAHKGALGESLCNVGDCLLGSDQFKEGLQSIQKANTLLADLVRASPHVKAYQFQLSLSYAILGRALLTSGDAQKAIEPYEQARKILQDLAREQPKILDYQGRLETLLLDLGDAHVQLKQAKPAQQAYEQARDLQVHLAEMQPEQPELHSRRGLTLHGLALSLAMQDRLEEARSCLVDAVRQQGQALARVPGQSSYRQRLSGHYTFQAHLERDLRQLNEALNTATRRLELWPANAGELYAVAQDFANTATACKGEEVLQRRAIERALDALSRAVKAGFQDLERIDKDPVWKVLAERDEFKKLLNEMASSRNKGPVEPPR